MKLSLEITEEGVLRLFVAEQLIGMVQALTLVADGETPPTLYVRLTSLGTSPPSSPELRAELADRLAQYKKLLNLHPMIQLLGPHDTLPSGMLAIKLPHKE